MEKSRRVDENLAINGLRATAALLVVIGHIRPLFFVDFSESTNRGPLVQALYLLGSLGHPAVIVFFVLSGYWVGKSVVRGVTSGTFSVKAYSTVRLARLWIVLVPAILLTQIVDRLGTFAFGQSSVYAGTPAYHETIPSDGAISHLDAVTTIGNLLFVQSIHVHTIGNDSPLWSLSFEFWYYLLFPAGLICLVGKIALRWRMLSAIVFIAGAIVSGPDVLVLFPTWLLGAAIAWKEPLLRRMWARVPNSAEGTTRGVLALAVLCVSGATIVVNFAGVAEDYVVAFFTALLIVSLIDDARGLTARRFLRPFSWTAGWSYSLYATHLPLLAFMAAMAVPSAEQRFQLTDGLGLALAAGVFAVVLASGFAFWAVTERNTHRVRDRLLGKRPMASVTAGEARNSTTV